MGLVEVVEPHDRAFFKATLLDMEEDGKRYHVRLLSILRPPPPPFFPPTRARVRTALC